MALLSQTFKFVRAGRRITGVLTAASLVGSVLSLVLSAGYVAASVVGRATSWYRLEGANQFGSFGLLFAFFLGLSYAFRAGAFVRVSALDNRGPRFFQGALVVFRHGLALVLVLVLEHSSWQYFKSVRSVHELTSDTPQIPVYIPAFVMVFGIAVFILEVFSATLLHIAELSFNGMSAGANAEAPSEDLAVSLTDGS